MLLDKQHGERRNVSCSFELTSAQKDWRCNQRNAALHSLCVWKCETIFIRLPVIIAFWCTIYLYLLSFLFFPPFLLLVLLLSLLHSLSLTCLSLHPPGILISLTRPNLTNLSTWWKGGEKKVFYHDFFPLWCTWKSFCCSASWWGLSGHVAVSVKCSMTRWWRFRFPEDLEVIWSSNQWCI